MYLQNSNRTFTIISIIFFSIFLGLLFFLFQGAAEIGALQLEGASPETSYKSRIFSFLFLISLIFFILIGNCRYYTLGKIMFLLLIDHILMRILVSPGSGLFITGFMSSSLWIIVFYGFAGYFSWCPPKVRMNPTIILFTFIYAILFLMNYTFVNSVGRTDYHYLESYYMITMLPFIVLLPRKPRLLLMLFIFGMLILAGKRAGLVAYSSAILVYILMEGTGLTGKVNTIVFSIIVIFFSLIIANFIFPDKITFLIDRFSSIESDGGSGRDVAYEKIFIALTRLDFKDLLIGHGHDAVVSSNINGGFSAHNEFLEMGWDYGLIGLGLYIAILICIISYARNKSFPKQMRVGLALSATIMFVLSMTSHLVLYTTYVMNLAAFWGYIIAYKSLNTNRLYQKGINKISGYLIHS